MKKILFLIASAAVILLTSCEGPRGPQGFPGPQGPQGPQGEGTNWEVLTFDIYPSDWKDYGSFLMAELDVPQLSEFIYGEGTVLGYIVYSDGVQTPLPSERYDSYEYIDPETGEYQVFYFQERYEFEFCPGCVSLFYNISDFYYDDEHWPTPMTVRLVLMW